MSDGCIKVFPNRKLATIVSKDHDWLEIIKNELCPTTQIKPHNGAGIVQFTSTPLCNQLISLGCTNAKSLTLHFPQTITDQYIPDFLRGIVDGDGCIGLYDYSKIKNGKTYQYKTTQCYIVSASVEFISGCHNALKRFGFTPTVRVQSKEQRVICGKVVTPRNDVWRLSFGNSQAGRFAHWLYYDGHTLAMPRKASIAQLIKAYHQPNQ